MAFFLGHHCQHEQDDIAARIKGTNTFLLEIHGDGRVVILQRPDPCDAVDEVPGEAADTLGHDHVELALLRMLHHELEGTAVLRVCAGIAIVHEGAIIDPVGIVGNQFLVGLLLQLHGRDLVLVIRRDPAVCGNAENAPVIGCLCQSRNLVDVIAAIVVELGAQGFLGALAFGGEGHVAGHLRRAGGVVDVG